VHLAGPLGILLLFYFLRGRRTPLVYYSAGFGGAAVLLSVALWASGGSMLTLWNNFRSSGNDLYLSHGGPNIWRFVYFLYLETKGVSGTVYSYRPPLVWAVATTGAALAAALVMLAAMLWRLATAAGRERPTASEAYLAFAIGSLVMSQFAPRAHINHSYGVIVLLLPLLSARPLLGRAWLAMTALLAYAHVVEYRMGGPPLLPSDGIIQRYGHADGLADAVRTLPAFGTPDLWLRIQAQANDLLGRLPGQAFVSGLSLLVAGAAVVMTVGLWRLSGDSREPRLRAGAPTSAGG
jgi:hypothetical protein